MAKRAFDNNRHVRTALSALVAVAFALSMALAYVPHADAAVADAHPHDAGTHDVSDGHAHAQAGHLHGVADSCDDDGHHDGTAPHGGACCKLSCHAALPVLAEPARAPAVVGIDATSVLAADIPIRLTSIDRPPRRHA